jgi:hypothetical protein
MGAWGMSENSVVASDVALLREACRLLRRLAQPSIAGESVKACQRRVYRRLKTWTFNRIRDVWRPDPRIRVRAHEIEQLRMAAEVRGGERALADLRTLQQRIEKLEQLLTASNSTSSRRYLASSRHSHR